MKHEKAFESLKDLLPGDWEGEGFAKFPTIQSTAYTELWNFQADKQKDAIHYSQHTCYKNDTADNGKTVFWDTGFILLKEEKIMLVSAQYAGRTETYELADHDNGRFVFNSKHIGNDSKTIRSQRIIKVDKQILSYELNMSTWQAAIFQNHLQAQLRKTIG
jgi:THAP4-like, heme-binding beta-barrel domain